VSGEFCCGNREIQAFVKAKVHRAHLDAVAAGEAVKELMASYVKYPPRKRQSDTDSGPITLQMYERFQFIREQLGKEGFAIPIPTGN